MVACCSPLYKYNTNGSGRGGRRGGGRGGRGRGGWRGGRGGRVEKNSWGGRPSTNDDVVTQLQHITVSQIALAMR